MYTEHGRVIQVMPVRQGANQNTGEVWKSQDFIIEMDGRYSRKVKCNIFGVSNVDKANLHVGEYVDIQAEVEAHEYKGYWHNEVRVFDVIKNGVSQLRNINTSIEQQMLALQNNQQTASEADETAK